VTDESLFQSIRELRQKLGDDERLLIKTVPRRGYLLDATPAVAAKQPSSGERALDRAPRLWGWAAGLGKPLRSSLPGPMRQRRLWVAAGGLLCVLLGAVYLSAPLAGLFSHPGSPAPRPASRLFTVADARQVAGIAVDKQLPLPAFQMREPARDVPKDIRRFIGIWVSDAGWYGSNRQFMLIVTHVDRDGTAEGYIAAGPPQPKSHVQSPAYTSPFKARISGDFLSYGDGGGEYVASLTVQNRIEFKLKRRDGTSGVVSLDPVWTLLEAERATSASAAQR
jgi:hypothetical protein